MNARRPVVAIALTALLAAAPALAAGDLGKQDPLNVALRMAVEDGKPRFLPEQLTLETGRLYALKVSNATDRPMYFGSQGLADAVYTRKVVALDAAGKVVAEIYGPTRRMEIAAGHTVEWWFLPVRTGRFEDVMSTRSLFDAGMRATIEVQ
ncbi:cupredoxin domain-containing protein [Methyloversatilis thermotolerans]|uniref:hypothetical protein n=1 Tax=Methyloversatilis thermotolerans TaxID=1346290 RepID=UPI0003654ABA|nr:hypothetical protein [Methyloversatilis thermotolerans]